MAVPFEQNNKERLPYLHYLEEMKKLDPEEAAGRTGVPYSAETKEFTFTLLNEKYTVSFPDFEVKDGELSIAEKILLMRYLLEGKLVPGSGKFMTYREMPWGEVYNQQFTGRCIMRLTFTYGTRPDVFSAILEKLGGRPIKGADRAYELDFMEGLQLRILLWEADDEFPPSVQILFSDNFQFAFAAEDMAVVGDITINRMKKKQ